MNRHSYLEMFIKNDNNEKQSGKKINHQEQAISNRERNQDYCEYTLFVAITNFTENK